MDSTYGHDAFLLESKQQTEMVAGFLGSVYRDVQSRGPADLQSHPCVAPPEISARELPLTMVAEVAVMPFTSSVSPSSNPATVP